MLAITLGYQANGNTAEPIPLYAGRDASKAYDIATNPPEGIVRTELFKNPGVTKRYQAPAPAPAAPELAAAPAPAEESAPEETPADEESAPEEVPAEEESAPAPSARGRRS